jgi:hypothetical protein
MQVIRSLLKVTTLVFCLMLWHYMVVNLVNTNTLLYVLHLIWCATTKTVVLVETEGFHVTNRCYIDCSHNIEPKNQNRQCTVPISSQYSDGLWAEWLGFDPWQRILRFSTVYRQALDHTQSPIQWVWGALSLGVK